MDTHKSIIPIGMNQEIPDLSGALVIVDSRTVGWEIVPFEADCGEWVVMRITKIKKQLLFCRHKHLALCGHEEEMHTYLEGTILSDRIHRSGSIFCFCVVPNTSLFLLRND